MPPKVTDALGWVKTTSSVEPKIWGKMFWRGLMVLTSRLMAARQYAEWLELIHLMPYVLPCSKCRKSCAKFITHHPPSIAQPFTWLFSLQNKVRFKFVKKHPNQAKANGWPAPAVAADALRRQYGLWLDKHQSVMRLLTEHDLVFLMFILLDFVRMAARGNVGRGRAGQEFPRDAPSNRFEILLKHTFPDMTLRHDNREAIFVSTLETL